MYYILPYGWLLRFVYIKIPETKREIKKMTKEELEKEAEEYSQKICGYIRVELVQAYLASAEPREKRIAELEEQIEKVKHYLDYDMPLDFINEATIMICRMLK
jgi:ribosomal protein L29